MPPRIRKPTLKAAAIAAAAIPHPVAIDPIDPASQLLQEQEQQQEIAVAIIEAIPTSTSTSTTNPTATTRAVADQPDSIDLNLIYPNNHPVIDLSDECFDRVFVTPAYPEPPEPPIQPQLSHLTPSLDQPPDLYTKFWWSHSMEGALYNELLAQTLIGLRADNGFKKAAWIAACAAVDLVSNQRPVLVQQCKNKADNGKALYKELKWLQNNSGFGWDDETGMVQASDDVWDAIIKV